MKFVPSIAEYIHAVKQVLLLSKFQNGTVFKRVEYTGCKVFSRKKLKFCQRLDTYFYILCDILYLA